MHETPDDLAALQELLDRSYGPEWEHEFLDSGPIYARIDADRMFTFHMPAGGSG